MFGRFLQACVYLSGKALMTFSLVAMCSKIFIIDLLLSPNAHTGKHLYIGPTVVLSKRQQNKHVGKRTQPKLCTVKVSLCGQYVVLFPCNIAAFHTANMSNTTHHIKPEKR